MATRDDLINAGRGLMDLAGGYYIGKRGEEAARAAGEAAMAGGEQVGMTGAEMAQFKPYTVTSALATGATTPEGGLDLQLSPEELARQQRRFEQAEGLFGRIGADPARAASEYYEAIRAAQRPEEERRRTMLQEGLFSRGRGGLTTGEYGGTAEQFAFEKAIAEAQLGAAADARKKALDEQVTLLDMAGALTGQAYTPQEKAIDLFGAAATPADIAGAGQRQAGTIYGTAAIQGLEGLLQGEKLASELQRQREEALLRGVTGSYDPVTGKGGGGYFDTIFGEGGLFDRYVLNRNAPTRPEDDPGTTSAEYYDDRSGTV